MKSIKSPRHVATVAMLLAVLATHSATANEMLRSKMEKVAGRVVELMQERAASTISVSTPDGPTTFGYAIRKSLEQELVKLLGASSLDPGNAQIRLTGSFYEDESHETLHIDFQFRDHANRPIDIPAAMAAKFARDDIVPDSEKTGAIGVGFRGNGMIGRAFGRSQDLLGGGVNIEPNSVGAHEGVSLQVISGGRPQQLYHVDDSGRLVESYEPSEAAVKLAKGSVFQLKVHNPYSFPIGVEFEIDGINSFALSRQRTTSGSAFTKWIIQPHQSMTLPGWFITLQQSKAFRIADYQEGVAVKLGQAEAAKLGILVAYVYRMKAPHDTQQLLTETRERTYTIQKPVMETKTSVVNGVERTYNVTVMVAETRSMSITKPVLVGAGQGVATKFSESTEDLIKAEDIAVLCIRYFE